MVVAAKFSSEQVVLPAILPVAHETSGGSKQTNMGHTTPILLVGAV